MANWYKIALEGEANPQGELVIPAGAPQPQTPTDPSVAQPPAPPQPGQDPGTEQKADPGANASMGAMKEAIVPIMVQAVSPQLGRLVFETSQAILSKFAEMDRGLAARAAICAIAAWAQAADAGNASLAGQALSQSPYLDRILEQMIGRSS